MDKLKMLEQLRAEPDEDLRVVQKTLEGLRKLPSELVDKQIFERLQRLMDSVRIARNTQIHVDSLTLQVQNLEAKLEKLTGSLHSLKRSFDSLDRNVTFNAESERQRNKKLGTVLEMLEQYLRRHS